MAEPWTFSGDSPSIGYGLGAVTLVEGRSFCLSSRSGDVLPGAAQGLFFLDTRFLSRCELRLDERRLEPLSVAIDEPFRATFLGRSALSEQDGGLMVIRRRFVGWGLREEVVVRNYAPAPREAVVRLDLDVDFADLFEVKEGRARARATQSARVDETKMRFSSPEVADREVLISFSVPAEVEPSRAAWEIEVPPKGEWSVCIEVTASVNGAEVEPRYRCGQPVEAARPAQRLTAWRRRLPEVDTDHEPLSLTVRRSAEDLGALRIFDPEFSERSIVAAGAPWFMTVFGRDSLITAWMALIVDVDLALGVLQTLARFQGQKVDTESEEEPGRILHEMRFASAATESLAGGSIYYGTVDATPLFVMLLGELRRWELARDVVEELMPHAERALQWIESYGDRDGDGYVEYQRASEKGLLNQGWKDSWDGIRFADGSFPVGPIALAEVQGYVYAAYVARAHWARQGGDMAAFESYRSKAALLRANFNRDFWLEDRGYFALGLDGEKRPIDALGSNMGHCLWTGIVDPDKASSVAHHLMSPEMFSGFGVRTLATSMPSYDPLSYHNGSVWPHDNAIIASGLMRYGFVKESHRIIEGMLDASRATAGRLPELFSGLGREELGVPGSYPTSCIPQAWAAAAPLMFLRTLLRFDPWVPRRALWLAPALPESMRYLSVRRIPLASSRIDVAVENGRVALEGLPRDFEVIETPREPLTAFSPD